jgi:hypothetical protein
MAGRVRSLGSSVVLGGVIGSAVSVAIAAACGGSVAPLTTSVSGDGGRSGDGAAAGDEDAALPVCKGAGVTGVMGPVDAGLQYYLTTYGVDPTCCRAQLFGVVAYWPEAGPTSGCLDILAVPCTLNGLDAAAACTTGALCDQVLPANEWTCVTGAALGLGAVGLDASDLFACTVNGCGAGRPPRGFVPRPVSSRTALGAQLAAMAQLEEASIAAFAALHADLAHHGAPASFLRSVVAARRDEIRHCRIVSREAERHGAVAPAAIVAPIPRRSLTALAIANAEEGCVVETFGAALLALQAERAADPRLRAMLKSIAADELRHAALSWRIADGLDTKLDARARRRVSAARQSAMRRVERELATLEFGGVVATPKSMIQSLLTSLRVAMEAAQVLDAA